MIIETIRDSYWILSNLKDGSPFDELDTEDLEGYYIDQVKGDISNLLYDVKYIGKCDIAITGTEK